MHHTPCDYPTSERNTAQHCAVHSALEGWQVLTSHRQEGGKAAQEKLPFTAFLFCH